MAPGDKLNELGIVILLKRCRQTSLSNTMQSDCQQPISLTYTVLYLPVTPLAHPVVDSDKDDGDTGRFDVLFPDNPALVLIALATDLVIQLVTDEVKVETEVAESKKSVSLVGVIVIVADEHLPFGWITTEQRRKITERVLRCLVQEKREWGNAAHLIALSLPAVVVPKIRRRYSGARLTELEGSYS